MSDKLSAQRHFELLAREPFGCSFLLCLVDEHGAPIAQFVLDARFARVLYVLLAAAGLEDVDEWRGFINAEELGKRCSDFSGNEDPLAVGTVRQLIQSYRSGEMKVKPTGPLGLRSLLRKTLIASQSVGFDFGFRPLWPSSGGACGGTPRKLKGSRFSQAMFSSG